MTKLLIENMGFPSALRGKAVGLIGVAAGRIGAIKSLESLKGCGKYFCCGALGAGQVHCTSNNISAVSHVGGILVPNATVSIAGVQGAFDPATGA